MARVHKELQSQLEDLLARASEAAAKRKEDELHDQRTRARGSGEMYSEGADLTDMASEESNRVAAARCIVLHGSCREGKCKRRRLGKKPVYEDERICEIDG